MICWSCPIRHHNDLPFREPNPHRRLNLPRIFREAEESAPPVSRVNNLGGRFPACLSGWRVLKKPSSRPVGRGKGQTRNGAPQVRHILTMTKVKIAICV